MTTAADTNVLLDFFQGDPVYGPQSREWLRLAQITGAVVICPVVYAELVPAFDSKAELDAALESIRIRLSPIDDTIAYEAGVRWGRYRQAGGPRTRILPDFLIGAHALVSADTFLTRDQGFYHTYFPELQEL